MLIFDAIILVLGLSASYSDINFRRIKNKDLVIATCLGLSAYVYLTASHQMTLNWGLTWNVLIGIGLSLILYFTDTWGAGDAKLFAVFCLLMPVNKYNSVLYFPSVAVFLNIFLFSIFTVLALSAKDIFAHRIKIFKELFSEKTLFLLGQSFLTIFSLNWFIQAAIHRIFPHATFIMNIAILFLVCRVVMWLIMKYNNPLILASIVITGITARFIIYNFSFNMIELASQLKMSVFYTFLIHGLFTILDLKNSDDEKEKDIIPFAPLMLAGTLLTHTHMLNWVFYFFNKLK